MSFSATEIIFNGISSTRFGLNLITEGDNSNGGIDVNIMTDKSSSNYKQLLLGVDYNKPLSFNLTLHREEPISRTELSVIQNWLFGHNTYKKLQIVQSDMNQIFYMCILNSPKLIQSGNKLHGIGFQVVCDSPFAYENEVTTTITSSGNITNTSDHWDYVYPYVEIVPSGSAVTIKNVTDNNRVTIIEKCVANEIIKLDGNTGIVTSSRDVNILDNFNKRFIRLLPNVNSFTLSGVKSLKIKYCPIRKVGG